MSVWYVLYLLTHSTYRTSVMKNLDFSCQDNFAGAVSETGLLRCRDDPMHQLHSPFSLFKPGPTKHRAEISFTQHVPSRVSSPFCKGATRITFIPSTFLQINIFETKIPGLRLKLANERTTDRHDNPISLICVEMRLKNRCLISILGTKHSLVEEAADLLSASPGGGEQHRQGHGDRDPLGAAKAAPSSSSTLWFVAVEISFGLIPPSPDLRGRGPSKALSSKILIPYCSPVCGGHMWPGGTQIPHS